MSAPRGAPAARPHAAGGHADAHEGSHVVGVGLYLLVFLALLVLTAVTVWSARHDFGALNTPLALGIAVLKAVLVILFFMHVKYSSRLVQLVVACAFVWLAIMILGILHDYYSPRVTPGPAHVPALSRE
jgi:cytochrome c oxidase subunit IV